MQHTQECVFYSNSSVVVLVRLGICSFCFLFSWYKSLFVLCVSFCKCAVLFLLVQQIELISLSGLMQYLLSLFSTGNALPTQSVGFVCYQSLSDSQLFSMEVMCRPICMRTTENMICNQAANQPGKHIHAPHIEMVLNCQIERKTAHGAAAAALSLMGNHVWTARKMKMQSKGERCGAA